MAWSLKWQLLKFGGIQGYRAAVPYFAGIILGDYVVGSFRSLFGAFYKIPTYTLWI